jgi:hypothetical protein
MFASHICVGYRLQVEPARATAVAHTIRKMVRRVLLAAAALLALGAAPALAARPQSPQQKAADLVFRAMNDVRRAHPSCRPDAQHPRLSHDKPGVILTRRYGVLRRPTAPGDALTPGARARLHGYEVFVDWVRVVHAAGHSFYVVPGLDLENSGFGPPPCGRLMHRRLLELLADQSAVVRRTALDFARSFDDSSRGTLEDTIWLYTRTRDGQPSQEVASFSTSRSGDSTGEGDGSVPVAEGGSLFLRLVRDGAASVTGIFTRRGSAPALRLDAPVVDNVIALPVPRGPRDTTPERLLFRAANGTVVGSNPQIDW